MPNMLKDKIFLEEGKGKAMGMWPRTTAIDLKSHNRQSSFTYTYQTTNWLELYALREPQIYLP